MRFIHPSASAASRFASAVLTLAFLLPVAVFAASSDEVWRLLQDGKASRAYDVATQSLPADDPDRDLLRGVSASESGRAAEAIPLLRRHLAQHPSHAQNPRARLELGRAYYQVGELDAAQKEFEAVLNANPPPPVANNIREALSTIRAEMEGHRPRLGGFAEFGLGYDSNINAGVKDANVNLPVFGLTTLADSAVARDAGVALLSGGVDLSYAPRRDLVTFGSARADLRFHQNNSDLDQMGHTLAGGVGYAVGRNQIRGSLSWSGLRIDYRTYRDAVTGMVEWNRQLDAHSQAGLYGQFGGLRYEGNNALRNARLHGLGLAYTRALQAQMKPIMRLSASYTVEDNTEGREDLGRDLLGARAGVEMQPRENWSVDAGLTLQSARHRAADPLLATTRKDDYIALDLGAGYRIHEGLSVRAELQFSRNDANIDLYDYKRAFGVIKLRWDFR